MKIETIAVGQLMTNCYLLCDENAKVCAVVDPGDEGERIADGKVYDVYCGLSQPDALSVELTGQAPIKTTVTFE